METPLPQEYHAITSKNDLAREKSRAYLPPMFSLETSIIIEDWFARIIGWLAYSVFPFTCFLILFGGPRTWQGIGASAVLGGLAGLVIYRAIARRIEKNGPAR